MMKKTDLSKINGFIHEILELVAYCERLDSALRFYANHSNWDVDRWLNERGSSKFTGKTTIESDRGELARRALGHDRGILQNENKQEGNENEQE
jgi:predicted AlkP superfamily phosphohydrolase/phosphomutase